MVGRRYPYARYRLMRCYFLAMNTLPASRWCHLGARTNMRLRGLTRSLQSVKARLTASRFGIAPASCISTTPRGLAPIRRRARLYQPQNDVAVTFAMASHLGQPVDELPIKPDANEAIGTRARRRVGRPQERCLDGLVSGRCDSDRDHGSKNGPMAAPFLPIAEGRPRHHARARRGRARRRLGTADMISLALAARGSLTGEGLIEVRPWAGLPVLAAG
jgi:hypothetical protein